MTTSPRNTILAAVALLAAAPAAAVSFTSVAGAPDPGIAAGEQLVVSFDAPHAAGVTDTVAGNVITAAGSIGGVRAAPAGDGGVYQSIGGGGSSTFDFTGFTGGRALSKFSVYWGSVDSYNFVDFLDSAGHVVRTVGGSSLPLDSGNQTLGATNRRVAFQFDKMDDITAVRFRSNGAAFEFDTLGAAAVPEPESWALMVAGFGFLGLAMRRRRIMAAA